MACEHDWEVRNGLLRNWVFCNKCKTRWLAKGGNIILFVGFSIGNGVFPWVLALLTPMMELALKSNYHIELITYAIWIFTVLTCVKLLNILHFSVIILWKEKEVWI